MRQWRKLLSEDYKPYPRWLVSKAKWISGFWIARGVFTTFSLLSTAPAFIDLSKFEIFRAVHILLWSWRELIDLLARLTSLLPLLPDFSPAFIATVIFVLNLWLPTLFALAEAERSLTSKLPKQPVNKGKIGIKNVILTLLGLMILLVACGSILSFYDIYSGGNGDGFHAFSNTLLAGIDPNLDYHRPPYLISLASVFLLCLGTIMVAFPRLRSGILFTIGTIICVEVCYFLGSPWLSEDINAFVCMLGEIPSERCKID